MKKNFEELMAEIIGEKIATKTMEDARVSTYWNALESTLGEEEAYDVLTKMNTAYAYAEYLEDVLGDTEKAMAIEAVADAWFEESGYAELVNNALAEEANAKLFGDDFDSEEYLRFMEEVATLLDRGFDEEDED